MKVRVRVRVQARLRHRCETAHLRYTYSYVGVVARTCSRAAGLPGSDADPCGNGHEGTVANMRVSGEAPHPQTDMCGASHSHMAPP